MDIYTATELAYKNGYAEACRANQMRDIGYMLAGYYACQCGHTDDFITNYSKYKSLIDKINVPADIELYKNAIHSAINEQI